MPRPLTLEEIDWQQAQPVIGSPSLSRLRSALKQAGLPALRIALDSERENIRFWLCREKEVRELDKEQTLRRLITAFRASGFAVGFVELAVDDRNQAILRGSSLVGPLDEVCEYGPPPVSGFLFLHENDHPSSDTEF
jgi:hypothetical protein